MIKLAHPSSFPLNIAWHFVAAVIIVAIPSQLIFGNSLWLISETELTFTAGIIISYLSSALLLTIATWNSSRIRLLDFFTVVLVVFGCYFLWILVTKSYYSRPLLLFSLPLSTIFILLPFILKIKFHVVLLAVITAILLATQFMENTPKQFLDTTLGNEPKPTRSEKIIDSAYYSIKATRYSRHFEVCDVENEPCRGPRNGGGISSFGNGYLIVNGEGGFNYFDLAKDGKALDKTTLPYRVPINSEAFVADGNEASVWLFRVMDVMVREKQDVFQLFVTHHFWKSEQSCFVMRISSTEGNLKHFLSGKADVQWNTVFETEPCLALGKSPENSHNQRLFSGDESGGRIALISTNQLLLTTGDHLFNGFDREEMLAQDPATSYGKTILIDLNTGSSSILTMGHRNPQGLYIDPQGDIWSTEHGPRGGDELNLLLNQKNYGWPLVTYGTDYGKKYWPLNENQGQHLGYQRPIYSWVPSIAVSSLIGIERDMFKLWQGDLLVASYKKILSRVRIREGRAVYAEPIKIGNKNSRIRDLMEDRDGRVVLWIDGGIVVFLEPALKKEATVSDNSVDGYFNARCSKCHTTQNGASHGIGPNLFGLFERSIAGAKDYGYSGALSGLSGSWTDKKLVQFLTDPAGFAPGTSMKFEGIRNADDRAKIIRHIKDTTH